MSQQPGPMDEYLSTPQCIAGTRGPDKMAPGSPGTQSRSNSTQDSPRRDALTQMSAELAAISANMFSRQDKKELVAELRAAIREEVAAVRRDLSALEHRVGDLEVQQLQSEQSQRATDLATTRQGNLLLELRRQVEDLENRGRRNNIRVRGLPESEGETPREVLEGLFTQLLGEEAPPDFGLERAHRALRPPRRDGLPRDLVCCFQSFQLKESIMRAARALRTITYMDSHVSLYQDLSPLTLDARRALKPITGLLQQKRIPYKWGFPFSLQARIENRWLAVRWPNDVPRFLRAAGLPETPVPNWILDHPPARPTGPTVPADHLSDGALRRSSTHRSGPNTAEE
ncbi:Hypothetical predicted protein [Pelobates cultripes]|uniref:L1 transposable element RRM domain-containing protein n=1 Tax=Pelobates cultripes TaxID=61616 RepID=A0AAD1R8R8_PELCU|nr:Hypothetical predicted protein [Pelobates cultripes]